MIKMNGGEGHIQRSLSLGIGPCATMLVQTGSGGN